MLDWAVTTYMGNGCSPGCRWWCLWWRLFVLSFFPRDVLDKIWDLIKSVSEGFPIYSWLHTTTTGNGLSYKLPRSLRLWLSKKRKQVFNVKEGSDFQATWLTWSCHVQFPLSQLITAGWINVICTAAGWIAHYPPDCRVNRCLFIRQPGEQKLLFTQPLCQ